MSLICTCCGEDVNEKGQANMSHWLDMVVCEDCDRRQGEAELLDDLH